MKIGAINTYNNQSKANTNKSNPHFGIKLAVDKGLDFFIQKEAINIAVKEGKPTSQYVNSFYSMYSKGIQNFAQILENLKPANMLLIMGLSNSAINYVNKPIDGNSYIQQAKEKPVLLGFMNPASPEPNFIGKPIDFPYTGVKAMENLDDVINLAKVYEEIV